MKIHIYFLLILLPIFFSEEIINESDLIPIPEVEIPVETPIPNHEYDKKYENNQIPDQPAPSDDFIKEWETIMGDFVPEDIKTFMVEDRDDEIKLTEEVSKEELKDSYIKGAFFIHEIEDGTIETKIIDPRHHIIMNYGDKREAIINFNCSLEGPYTIIFKNLKKKNTKITIATHFFHEDRTAIKKEEISVLEKKVKDSLKTFKALMTETKFSEEQHKYHTELLKSSYNKLYGFNVIETIIIFAVSIGQVYLIERLLNHKITV